MEIPVDDISYSNLEPFFDTTSFSQFYDKRSDELDASATYRITAPADGNIYIFYHVTGAESKNVTINTPASVITQAATQNCIFDVGYLSKGQTVTVNIPVEAATGTVKFCAYGIDAKTFEKGYKLLSQYQLNVSKFEDTEIEGSFTAPSDCLLYTSIPYSPGWNVYIDGTKVSDENIVKLGDSLLAVKVTKGEHDISFRFTVPGFKAGLSLTVFTVLMITAYALFNQLLRKRRKKLKGIASFPTAYETWHEDVFMPAPITVSPVEIIESVNLNLIDKTTQSSGPVREIIKPPAKEIKREIFSPENK